MQNQQPVWGNEFIKSLKECKMALNLSRGDPVKYYTSNRIASLIGNTVGFLFFCSCPNDRSVVITAITVRRSFNFWFCLFFIVVFFLC